MTGRHPERATDERTVGGERTPREPSLLIDVNRVATLLGCSPRHVWRLSAAHAMPAPHKIGALRRWDRAAVEAWVRGGCKSCGKEARA